MSDKASSRDGGSSVTGLTVPMPPGRRQSRTTDGVPMNAAAAYRRGSISRRPSIAGMSHHSRPYGTQQTVKFENTYRIDPDKNCKFHAGVVERMLAGLLESFLDGELYEARKCAQISQNLTDVIKGRMKELSMSRYKFVSNVLIGQNSGQSISFASRSIWNTATDNFASATYRNGSLFAVATVFAVYYE